MVQLRAKRRPAASLSGTRRRALICRYAYAFSAAFTRSANIGKWRSRAPLSWKIALAIAGATVTTPISPMPVGGLFGGYDLGVDFRHVAHAQHLVVVEVGLLDGAALDRQHRRASS
jgi:hypothetical protein